MGEDRLVKRMYDSVVRGMRGRKEGDEEGGE